MSSAELIRLDLLAALSQLGRLRSDWRLGQTLANLAMTAGRLESSGVWDLEDEEALVAARALIEQIPKMSRWLPSQALELTGHANNGCSFGLRMVRSFGPKLLVVNGITRRHPVTAQR